MTDDSKTQPRVSGNVTARHRCLPAAVAVLAAAALVPLAGQGGRGAAAPTAQAPAPTAQAAAPIDLTGYWVSIVTRRLALAHGHAAQGRLREHPDHRGSQEGRRRVGSRPRTKPPASSARRTARPASCACPTRLHITWQDDTTLKVETDAGTQTRLLHFGDWKAPAARRRGRATRGGVGSPARRGRGRPSRPPDRVRQPEGRDDATCARATCARTACRTATRPR